MEDQEKMGASLREKNRMWPEGCRCTWQQIHMSMPWQRTDTAIDCPVHTTGQVVESAAIPAPGATVQEAPDGHPPVDAITDPRMYGTAWTEPAPDPAAPIGLPPHEHTGRCMHTDEEWAASGPQLVHANFEIVLEPDDLVTAEQTILAALQANAVVFLPPAGQ